MPVSKSSNITIPFLLVLTGLALTVAPSGSYAQIPAAPTDADAMIQGETSIDLVWVDNSNNESAFDVFRSDGGGESRLLGAVDANLTLYQDRASGLVPDNEYCYVVRARNSRGSSDPSNEACVTIPARPAAPNGLISSRLNNNSPITLTWIVNSTNEDGFLLYRDIGDTGVFVLKDTVDSGVSGYEDLSIRESGRYCYFSSAFNVSGESDRSNISCIDVTVGDPTLPKSFQTEPLSGSEVMITWEFDDLITHSQLFLERSIGGQEPWTEILSTTELTTRHRDSELDAFTQYCYRLVLESEPGVKAITSVECSQTELSKPPKPEDVSADGLEGRSILVSWGVVSSPRIHYRLERREGLGDYAILLDSLDELQFTDVGLLDNEIYCYRVQSVNAEFESDYSPVACAIVAPSPVSNLIVSAGPGNPTREITASWQQGAGSPATSFEVSHRVAGTGEFSTPTVTNGISLLIEGLVDAVEYDVRVVSYRAIDSLSENSAPAFAVGSTLLSVWPGDMDDDGSVTENDVVVLTSPACFGMSTNFSSAGLDVSWTERAVDPSGLDETVIRCDADQNGDIDIFDFLAIAANFDRQTPKGKSTEAASSIPIRSEAHRRRLQEIYDSFIPMEGNIHHQKLKKGLEEILRKAGSEIIPDVLRLGVSYPNPVRSRASVPVDLPSDAAVTVSVVDAVGRRVLQLVSGRFTAGRHDVALNSSTLPPGIYFVVLETEGAVLTQPMVVVR